MTEQPTRKQPVWLPFAVVGGAVVVVMILWSALSSPANVPPRTETPGETFTLTGKLVVPAKIGSYVPDNGCIGDAGYSDIQPGVAVVVRSRSGSVLAQAALVAGRMESTRCAYAFTVSGVPRGEGSYQVAVANRGTVTVDEATAVTDGASLTLG